MHCIKTVGQGIVNDMNLTKPISNIRTLKIELIVLQMMCKSGLTHVITMDLHQKEIQGFFDCPVDNLRASPFLLQYIQESVSR